MRKVLFLLPIACCLFALMSCGAKEYTPSYTPVEFSVLFENKTAEQIMVWITMPDSIDYRQRAFTTDPKDLTMNANEKKGMKVSYNLKDGKGDTFSVIIKKIGSTDYLYPKKYKRSSPHTEISGNYDIHSDCTFTLEEETGVYKLWLEDK